MLSIEFLRNFLPVGKDFTIPASDFLLVGNGVVISAARVTKRPDRRPPRASRWFGRLWSKCLVSEVTLTAFRFLQWSPAVWRMRWYDQPMRIPTARIRELRASPTSTEKATWSLLRDRRLGAKFRRQFRLESGALDFCCFEHRLAIELDGGVHAQIDQMRKDAAKEDYLRTLGIRLSRIPNGMVLEYPGEFAREVVEAIRVSVEKARK